MYENCNNTLMQLKRFEDRTAFFITLCVDNSFLALLISILKVILISATMFP